MILSSKKFRSRRRARKGTILVLSAILMVVMMGFVALSVDVGYMTTVQTELDRAVDAGALAGAGALPGGYQDADVTARDFMLLNPVGNQPMAGAELVVEAGTWHEAPDGSPVGRYFEVGTDLPSAVRVTAQRTDQRPLFFAHVFGEDRFALNSTSVAMFQPRDIMVVLDFSASMNDDSEFKSIDTLGRTQVEDNLAQIYTELGSPDLGDMGLAPDWMTIPGNEPSNSYRPQIHVQYRYSDVYVTSTKQFHQVKVYRHNGQSKTYSGSGTWNPDKGVYEQTLTYNNSSRIGRVRVRSGSWDSDEDNEYQEDFMLYSTSEIRTAAKKAWSLNGVNYPYPSGSWDSYIDYCISGSSSNQNRKAGYRYKFGQLNFVNYLLNNKPSYSQTPDLWKTSEQPVTAVKNAVDVFLAFMQEANTSDRVGLAIYNAADGWGLLEQQITFDYGVIGQIARQRQAGHYHNMTNIGAGVETARSELNSRARANALKMVVLMTDGIPTFPYNSSHSRGLAIDAAQDCADDDIPVHTISLGLYADTGLMQEIADMTGGVHYRVPGGRPISEIEEDLRETFESIAKERPLQIVSASRAVQE